VIVSLFLTFSATASETEPTDTGRVVAQMVTSHDQVEPGQDFYVALVATMDPEWHIYWKNPGDSGEPVDIYWGDAPTTDVGEIIWPLPDTIPTGPIINYGFEGRVVFPMPVTAPENLQDGDVIQFDSEVTYLVCKDICIPESTQLSVAVTVGEPISDDRWAYNIESAIAEAPGPSDIDGLVKLKGTEISFDFEVDPAEVKNAYFFPETAGMINHSAPQALSIGETGLRLDGESGFSLQDGLLGPIKGVLRTENKAGEATGIWVTTRADAVVSIGKVVAVKKAGSSNITAWTALIGAFIGGLILNLMPCVFPIISIKALSFAKHAHGEEAHIRKQGWLYTLGVLTTFLGLTIALLALKAAGSSAGWGFQLQSPVVVGGLAVLFFAIGLNLLGAFEFRLGVENVGGSLTRKEGGVGTFFTGVLAVIVATPCTAPFMAGAIGFAFVQPPLVTLIVFMALGLGFALPFLVLSYWPSLLRRLPKPGPWMETFKQLMAFLMFGAVIWLIWVLSFQTSENGVAKALFAMLAFGYSVFMLRRSGRFAKLTSGLSIVLAIWLIWSLNVGKQSDVELSKQAWSPQTVAELRADGKAVFVDFTAAWCVTCKVNEQLVLKGAGDLFEKHNTEFLIADWTNKNDEIADELASYGRSGVPLYLLFPPGNKSVKAEVLPQILTRSVLEEALRGNLQ
jgi:thiol:disulfide interchange protein DsbD